ncbi:hypothetical protein [Actinokineospora inagensis]|nr:hypothetical protein [Actinokineospora inagensis]
MKPTRSMDLPAHRVFQKVVLPTVSPASGVSVLERRPDRSR